MPEQLRLDVQKHIGASLKDLGKKLFAFSRMGFLVFDEELGYVISVLYRGHVFSFGEESDEVGFVVESAVVADLGCAEVCVCQQLACFRHSDVVDIGYEGYACLFLEEVAECGIRHVHELGYIRQGDFLGYVLLNVSAYFADAS